jgi:hypothetical protein
MSGRGVLAIGFSHLGAIVRAYNKQAVDKVNKFQMGSIIFEPSGRHNPLFTPQQGKFTYNDKIKWEMERLIARHQPKLIAASLWGNQHFFLSVANSPRPFDFVVPGDGERETLPNAQVIPYDVMYAFMSEVCAAYAGFASFFRTFTDLPMVSLSAPPPVENFQEIPGGTSAAELDAKVKEFGIAPAALRMSFWRLGERVFRDRAREVGIEFISVPAETIDERGFRRGEYFGTDWIHASDSYGDIVLSQIDDVVSGFDGEKGRNVRASV